MATEPAPRVERPVPGSFGDRPYRQIVVPGWREYPRVDATADLYVHVIEQDITCATPRDHCNCAIAQAIKRAVGRPDAAAVIFPSVAYVLMPTDQDTARTHKASKRVRAGKVAPVKIGELAWHRFRVSEDLARQIDRFDETDGREADPGGFRFKAPTRSQRLDAKRRRNGPPVVPGSRPNQAEPTPWRRSRAVQAAPIEEAGAPAGH